MLNRITEILSSCNSEDRKIPPTELYNEGWLLRLVLDWFDKNKVSSHELFFLDREARWYSEILLPSKFFARHQGDKLAETYTRADGVIGHFKIGNKGKGDINLDKDAHQFKVLEAKMLSKLSSKISNVSYYNQAARSVACMAKVVSMNNIDIENFDDVGFHVLAPREQIEIKQSFKNYTDKENIKNIVLRRVQEYDNTDKNEWYENWFVSLLEHMDVKCISWEQTIEFIRRKDKDGPCLRILDQFKHQFALRILSPPVKSSPVSNRLTGQLAPA